LEAVGVDVRNDRPVVGHARTWRGRGASACRISSRGIHSSRGGELVFCEFVFCIRGAPRMTMSGIDVSHNQGVIDWAQVASGGVTFAFAKATEGLQFVDPQFASNWTGMAGAAIVRGAYHFFRPDDDPGVQAKSFLQVVQLQANDLPPVLDVEVPSTTNASLVTPVQAWLDAVEAGCGRVPIIYTNASFWTAHLSAQFGRYPLWIAEYGVTVPRLPAGWTQWTFWQHSQQGTSPGVPAAVDLDVFNGTQDDLSALIAASGTR
jgi:lysozyme